MEFLKDRKKLCFTGLYTSFFAFIIYSAIELNICAAGFRILAVLMFGLFLFIGKSDGNKARKADIEKAVIALIVLLFNIFMLQQGRMRGAHGALNIACGAALIIFALAYFALNHDMASAKKRIWENRHILFVIACFVLMSIEIIDMWPIWDTQQYYRSLMGMIRNFDADFAGIYGLRLCGHTSQGYSLWLILFQLFKEGFASVQIADIVLAGISIFAYYQILRKLSGKKYDDKILALAAVPYAFSPFVMGIVGTLSLDNASMYFAVIFIACSLYRYECLELLLAALLCFTKEPSVVCYVVYIVAKIICGYLSENSFNLLKLIKYGFGNVKHYIYALPAFCWFALHKISQRVGDGGWASDESLEIDDGGFNSFGINQEVVLMKLKQIFFLNFNWIFWLTIIIGIVILCVKKDKVEKELKKILFPIGAFAAASIIIGCVYITYVLPRYIVPVIPMLYIIAAGIAGNIKPKFFYAWNAAASVLLLAQCFYVFDPVMAAVFPARQIGSDYRDVAYETGIQARFDDHIAYNRQYAGWPKTFAKVLENAGYDGDMLIVVPTKLNSRYEILGAAVWNKPDGKLEVYDSAQILTPQRVRVRSCQTQSMAQSVILRDLNRVLYVVPKWYEFDESVIMEDGLMSKDIIDQGTVDNASFSAEYYVMDIQFKFPLADGSYKISPKHDSTLGLSADKREQRPYLSKEDRAVKLSKAHNGYELIFENTQDAKELALDVPYEAVNDDGLVWTWGVNHTVAQKWLLDERDGYYMICWMDYALTYDQDTGLVGLSPKTGEDSQLWSFN